jgi:hypothetical protein
LSILGSLFGTSKPDYAAIIRNVAANGGEGIVDTKYDGFAHYLRTIGKETRSTPDGLEAECSIGQKDHMVFLQRERVGGRDKGSTRISISVKVEFDYNDPNIGDILIDLYRPFIKTRSDAENVALSLYYSGQQIFVCDPDAEGEGRLWEEASVGAPSSLKSFCDRLPEGQECKDHRWIQDLDYNLLHTAGKAEVQVRVRYAIADAIVREYRLLS